MRDRETCDVSGQLIPEGKYDVGAVFDVAHFKLVWASDYEFSVSPGGVVRLAVSGTIMVKNRPDGTSVWQPRHLLGAAGSTVEDGKARHPAGLPASPTRSVANLGGTVFWRFGGRAASASVAPRNDKLDAFQLPIGAEAARLTTTKRGRTRS